NAYGFRIKRVADFNEEYALTAQVIVRGARWDLDVISALNEVTFFIFGNDETWYSTFYANDGAWSQTVVERFRRDCFLFWCGGAPPFGGGDFLDVAFGDLDEDSDLDAVFGIEAGRVLWYRNALGDGSTWTRYEIDNLADRVEAVAIGHIDRDSDNDIVIGTDAGEIWTYSNDGSWTPSLVANLGPSINVVKLADVYPAGGDGFNDIVAGTQGGNVHIYRNNGFGVFGTQLTADYTLETDIPVFGNITSGSVADTRVSDNTYEAIEEVLGPGEVWDFYLAENEILSEFDVVRSGSYLDTYADDGVFEVLEEEFYDAFWWFEDDLYLMRNSTGGAAPGHQYYLGTVPALGPTDFALLVVNGFISEGDGSEAFEIGYKVGGGGVTVLGTMTETTETQIIYDLGAAGFGGGDLYIVFQDTDMSHLDSATDGLASRLSLDQVAVAVVSLQGATSRLEHQWRSFPVGDGGNAYKLFIEAHHDLNAENDDFVLEGSLAAGGPWTTLMTITKTVDDNEYQTANLPTIIGGLPLYLRVRDLNRDPNATDLDTIYVDHIFVRRFITIPDEEVIAAGPTVYDLAVADMDGDGDNDIVVGSGNNVHVLYAPAWGRVTLGATGAVNAVDVGYLDGDTTYDIAAGTGDNRVYWWANDGTWTRTLVHTNQDDVRSLRVADMDGDFWDDIVIATEDGYIRWYRHDKGLSWNVIVIDELGTRIYAIDVGDVDRGVVIDPSL
ncbi:MAG: FG-GAP repeat domain-containing protein, partial [Thermoplasmata archaeon]